LTLLHDLPLVDHYFHPSGRVGLTETPVAPEAGESGALVERRRWLLLVASTTVAGLIALETTVISVALPSIRDDLGGGSATIEWVASIYLLTYAVSLLPSGRLVDRFGGGRIFVAGTAVYVGAALLGAVAEWPWMLIVGRGMQGVGAGMVSPAGLVLVTHAFGREHRGYAVGLIAMIVGFFSAVGPIVGGAFTDTIGWRAIFVVHALLAAVAAALVLHTLREERTSRAVELRLRSVLLLSGVVLGLQVCIIEGGRIGWPVAVALAILAALSGVALWRIERGSADKVLDFSLLRLPPVAASAISRSVVSFAFFGNLFYLTLFLESAAGYSAFETGLILLPSSIAGVLASPFVGRLVDRAGENSIMLGGVALAAVGLFALVLVNAGSSVVFHLTPALLLNGIGFSMVSVAAKTAPLAAVSEDLHGRVSSLVSFISRVASGLAVTFATAVFHAFTDPGIDQALDDQHVASTPGAIGFVDEYLGVSDLPSHLHREAVRAAGFDDVAQAVQTVDDAFSWTFAATTIVLAAIVVVGALAIVALTRSPGRGSRAPRPDDRAEHGGGDARRPVEV
jgi:EmrB/QacA subfamily drug resistance transporter